MFLFFGGFVLDPSGFSFLGTVIGMSIVFVACTYFLLSILNLFEVVVVVLPPPVFQNDCSQNMQIALAREKSAPDSGKYSKMKDEAGDSDYFDETI